MFFSWLKKGRTSHLQCPAQSLFEYGIRLLWMMLYRQFFKPGRNRFGHAHAQ